MSGAELATVDQLPSTMEQRQGIDVQLWAETLVFATQLANAVSDTEFVPAALRGRPEAVAATIMYGAEVGVTPMQALSGIHIVEGRPAPSAELMRAMILRAGHSYTIHEMSGTRVRVSGLRRGRPERERVTVEWSLDMARAAGLLGRRNWQNYPRAMLTARAFGDLSRVLFADVVKGLGYVAEDVSVSELDGWADDAQEAPQEAPRKRIQRKQRRAAPVVTDEPSDGADAVSELPPVAPPVATATPAGGVTQGAAAVESGSAAAALDQPDDGPRYDEPITQPPDPYDPEDVPLPDTEPEQTPPEPPTPEAGARQIGESSQMFRAMQAGLTKQLGTVATREERHALVGAILGKPVDTTKTLPVDDVRAVLDALARFDDGSASWQFDITTGDVTVSEGADDG